LDACLLCARDNPKGPQAAATLSPVCVSWRRATRVHSNYEAMLDGIA